jgi:3',5'-cyclic AMP phosphodiesterase CpdA
MLRIVHISDLHFGPPFVPEVGASLLRAIPPLAPDLVVVSGDFTQRAKPEQFQAAAAWLARLPNVPRVVVPGNHDVPLYRVAERLTRPLDLYRRHISPELDGVLRLDGAVIVWLDSTSPRRAISNGRLHRWQLRLCEEAFAGTAPETLRIVVAHHHFLTAPDFERDRRMQRGRRALDVLVGLRVDLILGGHLHRAYLGNSLDAYAGRDREHGVIVVQCGTSTSRRGRGREREKNSFNLIEAGDETITITHHLHFHDCGGFEPTSRHVFPRPGRRSFGGEVTGHGPGD